MRLVKAQFLLVVVGLSGFAQPSPQRERGNELMDLESMGKKAAVLNKTATDADVTPMGSESTSTVKLVAKTNSELLVSTAHQRNLSRQSPQTFSELDTATNEAQDAATEVLDRGGLPSDAAMNTPHIYEGQVKVCETYSRYAYPRWYKNINFSQYGYSYFNEENSSLRNTVKVEICVRSGSPCNLSDEFDLSLLGIETSCQQRFTFHKLWVRSDNGTFLKDSIKIPSGCECYRKATSPLRQVNFRRPF